MYSINNFKTGKKLKLYPKQTLNKRKTRAFIHTKLNKHLQTHYFLLLQQQGVCTLSSVSQHAQTDLGGSRCPPDMEFGQAIPVLQWHAP